ncbi:MAG: DEAD/DEAH box helicase family protein, partial [Planctomycetaceae bacterium]|nr:DEAD/DEAH box helicase family protein [Planctomycetaceae bacterium]
MPITFQAILDKIRNVAVSASPRDLGFRFEELMRQFFLNDPLYREQFSDVWLWGDWPERGNEPDTGIDLVAKNRDTAGYTAIQCKCYAEDTTIQRGDIDSFLVRSAKKPFTRRIIVSTTTKWSKHAEDAIHDQPISVNRLDIHDLEQSAIDWSRFDFDNPGKKVHLKPKKELREHQITAVNSVIDGFKTYDRGKLIMACGTGKTFTSFKIAEQLAGKGGHVLFLVPSLSLLSQTLREWTAESTTPLHCYAVCSDVKIGKHDDAEPTTPDDLAIPATTDGKSLAKSFALSKRHDQMTVVFSTYQSIDAISKAQKYGVPEFDLVICDEAHRTTGVTLAEDDESQFVRVHDAKFIKAKKRLYMTATPRLYGDESKKKAADMDAVLCSMDDETLYGRELYRLGFSEAVGKGLLSDYKVIVLAVSENHISRAVQKQLTTHGGEILLDDAVKIIGCWNGLSRKFIDEENANGKHKAKRSDPMKRAVAFTTTIKQSQLFTQRFAELVREYIKSQPDNKRILQCEVEHVDGKLNALLRTKRLEWLKSSDIERNHCRILSNAKCLSEGVDVPALDAVMFLNPRKSKVDVVQSVGRVMRKAEGKEYGYIILPIGIPADMPPEEALANNEKYRVVWDVLQALRAHDDRFYVTINQLEFNKNQTDRIQIIGVGDESPDESGTEHNEVPGLTQHFFDFGDIGEWKNAIFGKIVTKCGDKPYWEQWAKDVAQIATAHTEKIKELLAYDEYAVQFQSFLAGLRLDLNPDITEDDVIEMLSQHLITKPVFDAIFGDTEFTRKNPVSQEMEKMVDLLHDAKRESDMSSLDKFYESVQKRATGVQNAEGKQRIVIELYDKFFKTAFPRMAERLGIVYTPVEVVDFIIKSVDQALRQEFNVGIGAKDIHVLDPFTGTGTFIVRLLQSGLIKPGDLQRKYVEELHANEIILLAYYIAAVNIEETYHEIMRSQAGKTQSVYLPFEGIVLTDTFMDSGGNKEFEQTACYGNQTRL